MIQAVLTAGWILLAQVQAAPGSEVVQTAPATEPASQPMAAPAAQSAPSQPVQAPPVPSKPGPQPQSPTSPPPEQPEAQTDEPQTTPAPDVVGEGAYAQQAWEARLHAAYEDAEARQGPLDGGWRITGAEGDLLFELVLSDPGTSNITGAWRDLRRGGGADGSGIVATVFHTSDGVDVRFTEPGQASETVLQLRPTADGRWGGELTESAGVRSVIMTRF